MKKRISGGSSAPIRLVDVLSAAPDLLLAALYITAWVNPSYLGQEMVESLILAAILEFIVMHSSVMIGHTLLDDSKSLAEKRKTTQLLAGLYMIFAMSISLAEGSWWPAPFFAWLLLNRFLGLYMWQAPQGMEKNMLMGLWGLSALYYLVFVFLTLLLPLPELGLSGMSRSGGEGIWDQEPHRVAAFGALYFAANGITIIKAPAIKWNPVQFGGAK